jgi:hypothetical protein
MFDSVFCAILFEFFSVADRDIVSYIRFTCRRFIWGSIQPVRQIVRYRTISVKKFLSNLILTRTVRLNWRCGSLVPSRQSLTVPLQSIRVFCRRPIQLFARQTDSCFRNRMAYSTLKHKSRLRDRQVSRRDPWPTPPNNNPPACGEFPVLRLIGVGASLGHSVIRLSGT